MKISIDFETTMIKHMLKPGTEIKVILPTNPGEKIICYINGDEAHAQFINFEVDYSSEIALWRSRQVGISKYDEKGLNVNESTKKEIAKRPDREAEP